MIIAQSFYKKAVQWFLQPDSGCLEVPRLTEEEWAHYYKIADECVAIRNNFYKLKSINYRAGQWVWNQV